MIAVAIEQVLDVGRIKRSAHLTGSTLHHLLCCRFFFVACHAMGKLRQNLCAHSGASLDHKGMALAIQELGQGQVKVSSRLWSGVHRNAEAGSTSLGAVDGDHEHLFPARLIGWVDVGAVQKHLVLNGIGVQFTRAHAQEGKFGALLLIWKQVETALILLCQKDAERGRR